MKNMITFIGILYMGSLFTAFSQTPRALFDSALRANPALEALRQEYQVALEQVPQVSQLPQPQVGVGAFLSPIETRVGAQRGRLSASQRFPWFGTLEANKTLALSKAKVSQGQIAAHELEIYHQIQTAYFNLYELEASRSLTQENITLLTALKRIAESRVESGKTTLAEVLQIDLALQEYRQELNILTLKRRKPLAVINQLLYRPLETEVSLASDLPFAALPILEDTLPTTIHPELRIFSQKQAVAKRSLVVNTQAGKPTLGIGMDYILIDPRSDASPVNNGRDALQIQAQISVPIFREKYRAKQREEQLKIKALESQKAQVQSLFDSRMEQARVDHESARLKYEHYIQQIELTQSAIEILQIDYSNQGKGFDELLRLERDLLSYELKLVEAVVESHKARAEIHTYQGIIR
ncbi:MAG: TolC family protein [Bacteroidota bacterium]